MVGRRGRRAITGPAIHSSRVTRSSRNGANSTPIAIASPTRGRGRSRGRGRGRGRWANHWTRKVSTPGHVATDERSHIITLRVGICALRNLRAPGDATEDAETSVASSTTPEDFQSSETSHVHRSKRAIAAPKSLRTTRQSARFKPSDLANNTRAISTEADDTEDNSYSPHKEIQDEDYDPQPRVKNVSHIFEPPQRQSGRHQLDEDWEAADSRPTTYAHDTTDKSCREIPFTRFSRKRKYVKIKDENQDLKSSGLSTIAKKKSRIEEDAKLVPETALRSGREAKSQSGTTGDASIEEVAPVVAPVRGRGRRRGRRGGWGQRRGRGSRGGAMRPVRSTAARARGRGRGQGRGCTAAAAALRRGTRIDDEIWDNESRRRSPSPIPITQSIKDRQEELAALFKKVGQAQHLALSMLADHSVTKIVYDKFAHKEGPEFVLIEKELANYERKALEWYRDIYDLKVNAAEKVCVAEVHSITERAREKIGEIKQEMLHAARGDYMALAVGRQAAENDEQHTGTDVSEPDAVEPQYLLRIDKAGVREVERGFDAEAVRKPDGAAAHDRGVKMWEKFIKEVRLGEDLNPPMRALDSTMDQALQSHIKRPLESLLHAAQIVCDQEMGNASQSGSPKALSFLADIALAELPTPQLPRLCADRDMQHSYHSLLRTPYQVPPPLLPSGMAHGPTNPQPFIPFVHSQPFHLLSRPRHLSSARQQLGLLDPFAMNRPPQLPPPPCLSFRSLPLPNCLPPPLSAQPGPLGPPSMYYSSPNGHRYSPPRPPLCRY